MDFDEAVQRQRRGGVGGDEERRLNHALSQQTLRYSNFFLTISTNVVPKNTGERDALTNWLVDTLYPLFNDWNVCNGNVLKPAGTSNGDKAEFPDPCQIISVRSKISVEQGQEQHGQVHAHVVLEVAHYYTNETDGAEGGNIGVHVNVRALREYLNARIPSMDVENKPPKVYVNSKLLTKGTDNSNKWLTYQYINKDVAKDNGGGYRDLRADERKAQDEVASKARNSLIYGGLQGAPIDSDIGVGGALPLDEVRATALIGGKKYSKKKGPSNFK